MRLSFAGIDRLVGLDVFVALAVAVGVEHERRPALRLRRVASLVEHSRVHPSGHGPRAAQPERVVGVVAELRVMRAEAGVDEGVLHRLRIEHRHLPRGHLEREHLGRRMIGTLLAERGVRPVAHRRRDPHAALLVEHRVVVVGARVPELFLAPIGRGRERPHARGVSRPERFRHARIGHRHLERRHPGGLRVQDRHVVGRVFRRAVERAVAVDGRIAPVRGDQVVEIVLLGAPLPGSDHDVALDALRPLRLGEGQLALGDAIGPLAVVLVRHRGEIAGELVGHLLARLAGLQATHPCLFRRPDVRERRRNGARGSLAELVAADAADVLHLLEPVGLRALFGDARAAAEVLRRRNLEHRVPVDRGVVLRGGGLVRRRHRGEIEELARLGAHLGRIHQPVAAHPDAVGRFRQPGNDVAPALVGDHHLRVLGRQVGGLGDHPDARFRSAGARDYAAEVARADADILRGKLRRARCQECGDGRSDCPTQHPCGRHGFLLVFILRRA